MPVEYEKIGDVYLNEHEPFPLIGASFRLQRCCKSRSVPKVHGDACVGTNATEHTAASEVYM